MNVTAVLVTRGDCRLDPIIDSTPYEWPVVCWNNAHGVWRRDNRGKLNEKQTILAPAQDLCVYGRYAALEYVVTNLVYVQDDDVIVSDPQAIVDAWQPGHVVCNMPQEFRHDSYTDSALVGFGACFERACPAKAFSRYWDAVPEMLGPKMQDNSVFRALFNRTCDIVFTTLTPRILVDVPKTDREFASDETRMWRQKDHYGERVRMLELARKVRDA